MRVLVDTDVILDFLLFRPGFVDDAAAIWESAKQGYFEGYVSALTPTNVFYVARKSRGNDGARELLTTLLDRWHVCPVTETVLDLALKLPFTDFEDAVQHTCATEMNLDAIVTRNLNDYRHATLLVFSPIEFLARLKYQ
jgi:predicted nucleic acid-binding protein